MLENVTKGKKINIEVVFLKGVKEKSLGAIDKNPLTAFLMQTRFGIHTFFMKRSLDIIVLSSKGKVIKMRENIKPNRIFIWNPKYSYVIEAPSGSIRRLDLELENILRFNL